MMAPSGEDGRENWEEKERKRMRRGRKVDRVAIERMDVGRKRWRLG